MKDLVRGFGKGLVWVFCLSVLAWSLALILLPQAAMLERAVTAPSRQLDSSVAMALAEDAENCASALENWLPKAGAAPAGGMAIPSPSPSPSAMGSPSMGGMSSPNMGGGAGAPFILQCARTDTHRRLVRSEDEDPAWLDTTYGLPALKDDKTAPIPDRIAAAGQIAALSRDLFERLLVEEENSFSYTLDNLDALTAGRVIPMTPETRTLEDAKFSNTLLGLIGLRYEQDGQIRERIGLITLTRTLFYAMCATALALVMCYPIAFKIALATPARQAAWLMMGLVIPYAIVELMRIYAWTSIIDSNGLINSVLDWVGAIDLSQGEEIQFKRSPLTVFVVVVYTYVLFMAFPMLNTMSTLDRNQLDAARDLGASSWRVHWRIVIPHARPGIAVGCIATFMLAAGAFSVPRIISRGLQSEWFSQTIYNKFFESQNSNIGAAYAFAYTAICFIIVGLFMRLTKARLQDFARTR
ncbi:MAG: spermidine/putrescine transport system permease protein [Paracoccaceae bacterium]|jgi:spermidine/putrescine transport system permease protein